VLGEVPEDGFAGLRLREQGQVGADGALDGADFEPPRLGPLRRRGGYTHLGSAPAGAAITRLIYSETTQGNILAVADDELIAYDLVGAQDDNEVITAGSRGDFQHVGQPTARRTYFVNGAGARVWDGTAFATPTVTVGATGSLAFPKCKALAVTPWDNRLICAGFNGATDGPGGEASSESHVWYSEFGDPLDYEDTYYEILTPGDGQAVTAAVTWRDRVIVFKEHKLFAFYGTSIEGQATPALDYYAVDEGRGAAGVGGAAAGPDGVYFVDRLGICRTDGSSVTSISDDLDPLFGQGDAAYFLEAVVDVDQVADADMWFTGYQLFCSLPSGASRIVLTCDVRFMEWSYWRLPAGAGCAVEFTGLDQTAIAVGTQLARQGVGIAEDHETQIEMRWRGRYQDYGIPGDKTIHSTRIFGLGRIGIGYGLDFGGVRSTGQVTLGASSDIWGDGLGADTWAEGGDPFDRWGGGEKYADGWTRWGLRARLFSLEVRNVDGGDVVVLALGHNLADITGSDTDQQTG